MRPAEQIQDPFVYITKIMEMCITGYSVMDNSIKQSVIRPF